jgi:hypothetical protein
MLQGLCDEAKPVAKDEREVVQRPQRQVLSTQHLRHITARTVQRSRKLSARQPDFTEHLTKQPRRLGTQGDEPRLAAFSAVPGVEHNLGLPETKRD